MKKPKKTIHERIEKLKKQAEKEGMKIVVEFGQQVNPNWSEPTFSATNPKDEWEGVEFAECVMNSESYTVGKIYKINPEFLPSIKTYQDDFCRENGNGPIYFKPSTESAYVEQLKAKAFELFSEIKEADRFDLSTMHHEWGSHISYYAFNYDYDKLNDILYLGGIPIYKQGKWAKRCKERVKLKNWSYRTYEKDGQNYHECTLIVPVKEFSDEYHIFLTSKLEKYLNR